MPFYDFQCKCGTRFEDLVPLGTATRTCPQCGNRAKRKMTRRVAIRTNATMFAGRGMLADQFGDTPFARAQMERRVAIAKSKGYTPSANDIYEPTLAMEEGDPFAFLPSDDPMGYARRVIELRGMTDLKDESVSASRLYDEEPESIRLAEDLVEEEVQRRIEATPGLHGTDLTELREEIIETHGS